MTHAAHRLRLCVVFCAAALLFWSRLGSPDWGSGPPPSYVFDECYTAFEAHRLALGDGTVFVPSARRFEYVRAGVDDLTLSSRAEWSHPPGGPLVLAAFVRLFGFSEIAVRSGCVLAALLTLAAVASLAGPRRAWCACALLALDGTFFVLARTAVPHMLETAGIAAGVAALARALRGSVRAALVAGACFGFAVSVRWTAAPAILAASLVALVVARRMGPRALVLRSLACAGTALALYVATFLPFLLEGHSLFDLFCLHRQMLWFHEHLPTQHTQSTPWYTWPWEWRPVVFSLRSGADGVASVLCIGGKLLWWALVPATVRSALLAGKVGRAPEALGVAIVVGVWIPWASVNRYGMSYYLLPALPFAAIFVSDALCASRRRWVASLYLLSAAILFAIAYPVLSGLPLSKRASDAYASALRLDRQ